MDANRNAPKLSSRIVGNATTASPSLLNANSAALSAFYVEESNQDIPHTMTKTPSNLVAMKPAVIKTPVIVKKPMSTSSSKSLSIAQHFMDFLAKLHRLGYRRPIKLLAVAQACGYKSIDTKSFRDVKRDLQRAGHISGSSTSVQLSERSIAKLPEDPNPPQSNADFHAMIKHHFDHDKNICKLIDVLLANNNNSGDSVVANLEAANALGYKSVESHGFRNAKKALKELDFLEVSKVLSLTDKMFPFGRCKVHEI